MLEQSAMILLQAIRTEMKPELIPMAEDKSNFGKIVKKAIRWVWDIVILTPPPWSKVAVGLVHCV